MPCHTITFSSECIAERIIHLDLINDLTLPKGRQTHIYGAENPKLLCVQGRSSLYMHTYITTSPHMHAPQIQSKKKVVE